MLFTRKCEVGVYQVKVLRNKLINTHNLYSSEIVIYADLEKYFSFIFVP